MSPSLSANEDTGRSINLRYTGVLIERRRKKREEREGGRERRKEKKM
jgi:hypothetical protein